MVALYGIKSKLDAEPYHAHGLGRSMKKIVANGDGVANVAHDVVDPFLRDDLLIANILAAVLPASLLLYVSSTVSYLLHSGFTGEEVLKLGFAILVAFFNAVFTHRGAELLQ